MPEENIHELKLSARNAYTTISNYSGSNTVIQGMSGVLGFPYTLIADGAVIFTLYTPMINKIRKIYDRSPIDNETLKPILINIGDEILFDIIIDKILGQIPLAGIYFNIICAKAMTWRIGLLFAVLSSRGDEIDIDKVGEIMELVRKLSPQNDVFRFKQPPYAVCEKILISVHDNNEEIFSDSVTIN